MKEGERQGKKCALEAHTHRVKASAGYSRQGASVRRREGERKKRNDDDNHGCRGRGSKNESVHLRVCLRVCVCVSLTGTWCKERGMRQKGKKVVDVDVDEEKDEERFRSNLRYQG